MKKTAAFLAAVMLCASMTACTAGGNTDETAVSSDVSETAEVTEASVESLTETEETSAEEENIEEDTETEAEDVKEEQAKYVDYVLIEDHRGTADIGGLADKAAEFLKTTDEYSEAAKRTEKYSEAYPEYYEDGVLVPKLRTAYPEDYDGDGKTETFILADIPYRRTADDNIPLIYSFLIFADSEGNMTLLDYNTRLYDTELIDYGKNKQLVIGGSGTCGAEDHTNIWGVRDGKAVDLYCFRGSIYKQDCFVSVFGWQSVGDTLWFDPEKLEYRPVLGEKCDISEIREMDRDGNIQGLENYDPDNENMFMSVSLIGGKYYCVDQSVMDSGMIYTYDGDKFTLIQSYLRNDRSGLETEPFSDFDYDEMLSEMAAVPVDMPSYSLDDLSERELSDAVFCYMEYAKDNDGIEDPDKVKVYYYLGVHGGYDMFAFGIPDRREDDLPGKLTFGDETVKYIDGNLDIVLCSKYGFSLDPMFGKLTESMCITAETAYDNGILRDSDVEQIKALIDKMGV